jgi:hypothetical protein
MDRIDEKYIGILEGRIIKLKKVRQGLYNCRCPLCGDSQRNKSKTRGYFYQKNNNTNYKCHNCGASMSFNNFLKVFDSKLHADFCFEKYTAGFTGKNFPVEAPKIECKKPVFREKLDLPLASSNDSAKSYLESRKLNPDKFYYAEKFKEWTNSLKPTFDEATLKYEEQRIVIPLHRNKKLIGFQGRALTKSEVKYITIMLDEDFPKVYNIDNVDVSKNVYILEGPFDSEFISNSIAMCGADINLKQLNILHPVFVYDNEPRNKDILKRMEQVIIRGESIVIWPEHIHQKDINLMVMSGVDVMSIIENNTYTGLEATLKFNFWKKNNYEQSRVSG